MVDRFDRRLFGYCSRSVLIGIVDLEFETPKDVRGLIGAMFREDLYIRIASRPRSLGARS